VRKRRNARIKENFSMKKQEDVFVIEMKKQEDVSLPKYQSLRRNQGNQ
jgi:hypothetical protein